MSVLLHDAQDELRTKHGITLPYGEISELIYADDTLLIGAAGPDLEEYLRAVSKAGAEYGLQLHWDKFQYVAIGK